MTTRFKTGLGTVVLPDDVVVEDCEVCECAHLSTWYGDCRDDDGRLFMADVSELPLPAYIDYNGDGWNTARQLQEHAEQERMRWSMVKAIEYSTKHAGGILCREKSLCNKSRHLKAYFDKATGRPYVYTGRRASRAKRYIISFVNLCDGLSHGDDNPLYKFTIEG